MESLKKAPHITLYILFFFLFYLSSVKHIEVLIVWVFIVISVILIFSPERIKNLKSVLGVLPFVIMVLLPFVIRGFYNVPIEQRYFSAKLILRLMCAMMTISFISSKYSYLYLVEGVMKLGLPNFLNQIISLTFRYFFMVRTDLDKTAKAMSARCFDNARTFSKVSTYGEMIGGFFLKAADHGDKVYNAMRARGFTSETKFKPEKIASPFYISLLVFFVLLFIGLTIIERFMEIPWLF